MLTSKTPLASEMSNNTVIQECVKVLVFVKVISGVLVRSTTCKRLINSLPQLSLIALFPPETAGYQVDRTYRRTCQYIQAVSFPGYTRESIFQVRNEESLKKFITVDVGFEPTTQKKHGLSTTPFSKVLVGY